MHWAQLIRKSGRKMQKQNLFYIQEHSKSRVKPKPLIEGLTHFYDVTPAERQFHLSKDDLNACMRFLLCFGRIFGIVPISGLFTGTSLLTINFRIRSLASITSIIIIAILTVNDFIALLAFFETPAQDANQIAKNIGGFICYSIGLYVYAFMYRKTGKLIECFHKWRELKTVFYREDTKLFRSIVFVSGIIFTSAILENLVSHWKHFKGAFLPTNSSSSVWEKYYRESHEQYLKVVPYNMAVAIAIFLCNKWAVYAWNFGDVLVSVIARAMYKRFQLQLVDLKEKMDSNTAFSLDGATWNQAVKDHENLVDLLEEFGNLLSPLIFACASTNIYFICMTLNSFLVPSDQDVVNNVYAAWAFIHLILRTFITIWYCAKVNEQAHKIVKTFEKCPISVLTKEVERLELKLRTSCIEFGGFDCFTITKPFLLSVFSVIFTFETVLLQSTMTPLSQVPVTKISAK